MTELLFSMLLLASALLFVETTLCEGRRLFRRHILYARRHCTYGHTWSKPFGPFKHEYCHYIGWRCLRCPMTKTEYVRGNDAEAAKIASA